MKTNTTVLLILCCLAFIIQQTSAQSYFRTEGDARIQNDAPTLNFTDTDDNRTKGQLQVNGDDFRISNGSGDIDIFNGDNNTINPRVKIKGSTGFVGIGTENPTSLLTLQDETTDGVGGAHQLFISERSSSSFGKIKFQNRSATDGDYWEIAANSTSTDEFQINFRNSGFTFETPFYNIITVEGNSQQVGINTENPTQDLSVNGTAGKPGGGNWAGFSDRRLKKDIAKFTDGLNEIIAINPVTYRYNEKARVKDTDKTYVGIIAQEMRQIAPYTIEESTFDNGTGETYLSYDGSALVYMLVNAVKEQQIIIDDKIDQIENLESRLDKLEDLVKNISSPNKHFDVAISNNK